MEKVYWQSPPLSLNFENGGYLHGYRSLFPETGQINRDEGSGITRDKCKDGYSLLSLFRFDANSALCQVCIKTIDQIETREFQLNL